MPLFPESLGRLRFLPVLLLIGMIGGVIGLAWVWWQDSEMEEIRREIDDGRLESAAERAQRLERLSLQKREVTRLRAISIADTNPKESLRILQPLTNDPTSPDHQLQTITFLRIAIENELFDQADAQLEQQRPFLNHVPDFLYWQARYLMDTQNPNRAIEVLNRLLSINSNHGRARLLIAQILLNGSQVIDWVIAKVNLRIAAGGSDDVAKEALFLLATRPEIPMFRNDRAWLMHELRKFETSAPELGLLAANQEMMINADERQSLVGAAIKQFGADNPRLVALWLLNIQAFDQLTAFLNSSHGKKIGNDMMAQITLRAALAKQDYHLARKILSQIEPDKINQLQRATLMAVINDQQQAQLPGTPTPAWQDAQELALKSSDLSVLLTLARIAARRHWWEAAGLTYDAAIPMATDPGVRAELLSEKITVELKNGNTAQALRSIQQFLNIHPEHGIMLNNAYYLDNLLDQGAFGVMQYPTEELSRQLDGTIWSTYALAMWRQGNPEAAQEAIQRVPQKYRQHPSCQLVTILVAIQNRDIKTARELIDQIPDDGLLPEERELLREARQQIQS